MTCSEDLITFTKSAEGYREVAYRDSVGIWTVGYGWTQGVKAGTTMSESLADRLLRGRMNQLAVDLGKQVLVKVNQKQFDALCDFEYNLGRSALDSSTLLRLLNQGQYELAAEQFPRWCHAGDTVLPGLLKRRIIEQNWFKSDYRAA